MKRRWKKR